MLVEIKVALNFLLSFLYDKLPRRRVNLFGDELEKLLKFKINFNTNPNTSILCSIKLNKLTNYIDPCLSAAAKESAMDLNEIIDCLPTYLKIYLLNGKVCYKSCSCSNSASCKLCTQLDLNESDDELLDDDIQTIPAKQDELLNDEFLKPAQFVANPMLAQSQIFNKVRPNKNGFQSISRTVSPLSSDPWSSASSSASSSTSSSSSSFYSSLNLKLNKSYNDCLNENQSMLSPTKPSSPLSASLSLSTTPSLVSPISSTSTEGLEQQSGSKLLKPPNSVFTTATFAQTKFGSTKSKNYVKVKQQKMLPNEFSAYIKQKAMMMNEAQQNEPISSYYKNNGLNQQQLLTSPFNQQMNELMYSDGQLSLSGSMSSCSSSSSSSSFLPVLNSIQQQQYSNVHSLSEGANYQPFELIVNSTIKDLVDDDCYLNEEAAANGFDDMDGSLIQQLNKLSVEFGSSSSS